MDAPNPGQHDLTEVADVLTFLYFSAREDISAWLWGYPAMAERLVELALEMGWPLPELPHDAVDLARKHPEHYEVTKTRTPASTSPYTGTTTAASVRYEITLMNGDDDD